MKKYPIGNGLEIWSPSEKELKLFSNITILESNKVWDRLKEFITQDIETIIDMTGCIGGDSMYFAKFVKHLTSYELLKDRYEALVLNTEHLKNVTCINTNSYIDILRYNKQADLFIYDPPWDQTELIEEVIKNVTRKGNLIVKVPMEFNKDYCQNEIIVQGAKKKNGEDGYKFKYMLYYKVVY